VAQAVSAMPELFLTRTGTLGQRAAAARRALKAQGYRLKSRGTIKTEKDPGHFAIVNEQSGEIAAGGSLASPELSLEEVEAWFDAQRFTGRVALDGSLLPDLTEERLSKAQREALDRIKSLSSEERADLIRYILARLPI
jgi:hypothetical protein